MFAFARKYLSLETLKHPKLLEVGYFYGNWNKDGSFVMGKKGVNVKIDAHAVEKTVYELNGVKLNGIPERAVATGIKSSEKNPKRKRALVILEEKDIEPFPNKFIHVNVFGMRFDWTYHFAMVVLNTIGAIRVNAGLAFDPWR